MLAVNPRLCSHPQSLAIIRGGQYLFPRVEQVWCGEYFPDAVYALAGNGARLKNVCSERQVEVVRRLLSNETTKSRGP